MPLDTIAFYGAKALATATAYITSGKEHDVHKNVTIVYMVIDDLF